MKNTKRIIIILLLCISLYGCGIKNANNMVIHSDGSLEYEILVSFDREFIINAMKLSDLSSVDYDDTMVTDDDMMEYIKNNATLRLPFLDGLDIQYYKDENYLGAKYFYEVDDIDKVSTFDTSKVYLSNYTSDEKLVNQKLFNKVGYNYTADFIFDFKNNVNYDQIDYVSKFSIMLPDKSISNNADLVSRDGKLLTWNLDKNTNEVNFTFSLKRDKFYYVLSIVSIILIIIATLYVLLNGRKISND